jgi:hypothetical protein
VTTKRHHFVLPARDNGQRDQFEWHSGLRENCAICRTDTTGNSFPHPLKLRKEMHLVTRENRYADSQGIPGTRNGSGAQGTQKAST